MRIISIHMSEVMASMAWPAFGADLTIEYGTALIIMLLVVALLIAVGLQFLLYKRHKKALAELKSKSEALSRMADHDGLTGLMNRSSFMKKLQETLIDGRHAFLALFVIDIENLRMINDAYGHDVGDLVVVRLADILKGSYNEEEAFMGINQTDFLVAYQGAVSMEDIKTTCEYMIRRLSGSMMVDHMEVSVRVNVGVSLAPDHSMEGKLLFKKANMACMEAGRMGQNQYNIFKANIYKDALKRITLEKQLRRAIVKSEFEIYYQPRINLETREVCGGEALIRWNHPEGRVVYPGQFIGIAESHGFISEITRWVVREVVWQTNQWAADGHRIKVSFNISGKEFDDDFVRMLDHVVREEKGDPSLLEVEITETATLTDMDYSKVLVGKLQDMGFSVALDDFGTGYSSMTYIKKLNADKLKIDRSFIEDIDDYQQRVVVESMIELGKKLDYQINVEGVETIEQLQILESMTVDEIQGWYFSKAIQAEAFYDYVLESRKVKLR